MTSLPVTLALCFLLLRAAVSPEVHLFIAMSLQDAVFTERIDFESPAVSVVQCAQLCRERSSCQSCTFFWNKCRGHDVVVTSHDNSFPVLGSQTFVIEGADWRYASCIMDSECTETNAECYEGRCLCTPGYFYSVASRTCTANCSQLHPTYSVYLGGHMSGQNKFYSYTETAASCQARCTQDPQCLTYEMSEYSRTSCGTHHVTALTAPDDWTIRNPLKFNLSQRNCA